MDNPQEVFDNQNYQSWREIHTRAFGDIFSLAFEGNPEAQMHLTAALILISKRQFTDAMPKLNFLASVAEECFDEAAVNYFMGLNYEFMEMEAEMSACYDKVLTSDVVLRVPFAFHPFYRTAKFAQRESECSKAIYYYRKALAFYDGMVPDEKMSQNAGQIMYDVATVYLYMHRYEDSERFLEWSKTYTPVKNEQRDFVAAILCAVQGKEKESRKLLRGMHAFFKRNCEPTVNTILSGTDPHYCIVPQDRQHYSRFWENVSRRAKEMEKLLTDGDTPSAESILSELLTDALPFMKRNLACRMNMTEKGVVIYCKDYHVRTLTAEFEILFSESSFELPAWQFVVVHEFEPYDF